MKSPAWRKPETAPKDGTAFLAHLGYPWPVVALWNGYTGQWVYASTQIGMVDGKWNDAYFENEYEPVGALKGWMPLPEIPRPEK